MVLTTHEHWDHSGGNDEMKKLYPNIPIVGSTVDNIPGRTKGVEDGEEFTFGHNIIIKAFMTPCHTRGHILYLLRHKQDDVATTPSSLFSGDTLFVAGCGRFFVGTAAEMHYALNTVCAALPDNTKVYCGHEYTLSNLQFAATVDPNNKVLQDKLQWAKMMRKEGKPTIPSSIKEEKDTNPFMRVDTVDVAESTGHKGGEDPISVMKKLREMKDSFKPPKL